MFEPKWISFYFFSLSALIQFSLFVIEAWVFTKKTSADFPAIFRFFGLTDADVAGTKDFVILSAFNHLFIAAVTVTGLRYVLKLQPFIAGPISSLGLFFTIIVSIVYLARSKKYWKVSLVQLIPALLGFAFLISHILPAIRAMSDNLPSQ